jgi:hypothetical protein
LRFRVMRCFVQVVGVTELNSHTQVRDTHTVRRVANPNRVRRTSDSNSVYE